MTEAVIIDAVRTPGGRRNGMLKDQHPAALAAHVLKALQDFGTPRTGRKHPSAWADAFEGLLARCGWPTAGDDGAVAGEHDANWQAYQAWQDALRELAELELIDAVEVLNAKTSLDSLNRRAAAFAHTCAESCNSGCTRHTSATAVTAHRCAAAATAPLNRRNPSSETRIPPRGSEA